MAPTIDAPAVVLDWGDCGFCGSQPPGGADMAKRTKINATDIQAERDAAPTDPFSLQTIYCGDNLDKLSRMPGNSVDLIYIDPPFNSNRNYEVFWGETKEKRAFEDRRVTIEAYLNFMEPRCRQLHRVLKRTGAFYYHCDWHASHSIKLMLDDVFGVDNYRNEIIWKRADTHNDARTQLPVLSESIFYYAKSPATRHRPIFVDYPAKTMRDWYIWLEFPDGSVRKMTKAERTSQAIPADARRFNLDNTSAPAGGGMAAINKKTGKPNGWYVYKGYEPSEKGWRYKPATMAELDARGELVFPKKADGRIMRKRYLDHQKGVKLGNVWTDIPQLRANDAERLGYPTQKPLNLLKRIVEISSDPDDIVLDAFCGCGTALEAAQSLDRRWIGIDISPTACRLMSKRLKRWCHLTEGKEFFIRDLPKTPEQLKAYPPFEFENWAVNALNTVLVNGRAIGNRAKVGDMGIDGRIYPIRADKAKVAGRDLFGDKDVWLPVQVKQKDKAGRPDIDMFQTAMRRQKRDKGEWHEWH